MDARTIPPMDEPTGNEQLRHTPLEAEHQALGAKMGPFAGWNMPIEYAGALKEHEAVRERVGLFDLTHLGKVEVTGPGAMGLLQSVVTNDLAKAAVGEALYNLVLNEGGGVIEDLIVYRLGPERYFVVPNAANAQPVLQILEEKPADGPRPPDVPPGLVLPRGAGAAVGAVMQRLFPEAADLAFMRCVESEFRRRP